MSVDLSADSLRRLEAEAARRGLSVDAVIAELVDGLPVEGGSERVGHRFSFTGVAASGDGTLSERYKTIRRDEFGS